MQEKGEGLPLLFMDLSQWSDFRHDWILSIYLILFLVQLLFSFSFSFFASCPNNSSTQHFPCFTAAPGFSWRARVCALLCTEMMKQHGN